MTDVEKVKQYLTMSSEDEAKAIEYLHQEIDPIDQKCRIEICESCSNAMKYRRISFTES